MRISDWTSDVCSADLLEQRIARLGPRAVVDPRKLVDLDEDHPDVGVMRGMQVGKVADARGVGVDNAIHRRAITGFVCQALAFCITIGAMRENSSDPATLIDGHGRRISYLRSEEHTSELQSLMRISYAVFC